MGHQPPQGVTEAVGQSLHRLLPVSTAKGPGHPQPVTAHAAVDLQEMEPLLARGAPRTRSFPGRAEQALCCDRGVELPEVVEGYLGQRQGGQSRLDLGASRIAQHAEDRAAPRHRPELFLDYLEQGARLARSLPIEKHRREGGEPPDRPGDIQIGEDLLAAVSLQIHQQTAAAGPRGKRLDKGGEQNLIDPHPVGARHLDEQAPGLIGRERHMNGAGSTTEIRTGFRPEVDRQRSRAADPFLPEGGMGPQAGVAAALGEPAGPAAERHGARQQRRLLPTGELPTDRFQLLEQHAPRHAVHHQVVRDEEEPVAPVVIEAELCGAEDGPCPQLQARLESRGSRLQGGAPLSWRQSGEIDEVARNGAPRRDDKGAPLARAIPRWLETEPESTVAFAQQVGRPGQEIRRQGLGHLQQKSLVVMIGLHRCRSEEPALDRGEEERTGLFFPCRIARHPQAGHGGQPGDGRTLEELPHGQMKASPRRPRDHLDRQDRVASAGEEVVVHPDTVGAQHPTPDRRQRLLGGGAGGRSALRPRASLGFASEPRQDGAVHFAVAVER